MDALACSKACLKNVLKHLMLHKHTPNNKTLNINFI